MISRDIAHLIPPSPEAESLLARVAQLEANASEPAEYVIARLLKCIEGLEIALRMEQVETERLRALRSVVVSMVHGDLTIQHHGTNRIRDLIRLLEITESVEIER